MCILSDQVHIFPSVIKILFLLSNRYHGPCGTPILRNTSYGCPQPQVSFKKVAQPVFPRLTLHHNSASSTNFWGRNTVKLERMSVASCVFHLRRNLKSQGQQFVQTLRIESVSTIVHTNTKKHKLHHKDQTGFILVLCVSQCLYVLIIPPLYNRHF